jgi:hypothetical protein
VKPSNGRISKKKKKGPAPSKDTKKIQHPTPFANPKPVKDASNVKYEPKSPKAEKVPLPESRPILQPERLMPNAQPILPDALEMRDPEPEPSKMAAKTNNSHNLDLPNIFPAERRDEGSMNNGGGFYGQYRCGKCGKYWRSSFARENVPQNCSRCKTPTLPSEEIKTYNITREGWIRIREWLIRVAHAQNAEH